MPEKLAVFDIDHTITRHSTGEYFLLEACRRHILPWRLILSVPKVYFQYRFGHIEWDNWGGAIAGIQGIRLDLLEELSELAFRKYHLRYLHREIHDIIRDYKQRGIPVLLATSSVDIFVQPLADYLEVDGLLATRLEFADGQTTGRLEGKPVFGREKLQRINSELQLRGLTPADCAFYSDSIHDLPLLEASGRPVAVNPDFRLKKTARKHGWQILHCRKPDRPE